MLTKRQKQVLDFIQSFTKKQSYGPSLDEIRKHLKLSSVSTVHNHLKILKEKGYIKQKENVARSIEVGPGESMVEIPLLGSIAAGEPIEAIQTKEPVVVPKNLLSKSGKHYALKVSGNSMINDGIFDEDIVIIRNQATIENGETAVALINGNEVTLKKIYKEKNRFRLQPANTSLKPIFVKNLTIQGKVISIFRNIEENEQKKKFKFNRIISGDVLQVMKKIPDNSIHLAITSPPYNVGKDYDNHHDKMNYQDYLNWLYKVWEQTKRVLVPGGRFALNIAPTGIKDFIPIHHDFINQFRELGMKFRTEIIWYKQTMLKRTAWGSFKSPANPHIVPSWEYVLIFTKEVDRLDGDSKMADITKKEFMDFSDGFWQIFPETKRKGHPAPFPEKLIYRLIKFYSYKGNNVLDMFGGTGTVAAVAAKTGRSFLHIDISKQYCKVAKDRVNKELKQKN
jgi:SOS regulatory protein LexA